MLLALALAGCQGTDDKLDRDGDGLYTQEEVGGWIITVDLVGQRVQREVDSDPSVADTDGDGLRDSLEAALNLDPRNVDTDDDGWTDCQEALHTVREECESGDFEGPYDGGFATEANRQDSDPGYSRYVRDVVGFQDPSGSLRDGFPPYGDGIPDRQEAEGYDMVLHNGETIRVRTDPMRSDTDRDGLEDGEEAFLFRVHPGVPDTDGDGCQDGADLVPFQEERLHIGLRSINLSQGGDIRFRYTIADALGEVAGDGLAVTAGNATDLSDLPQDALRPPFCSHRPHDPWVQVELFVERLGERPVLLDLTSRTNPDGTFAILWNPYTDELRWPSGETVLLPEPGAASAWTWRGADGEIVFAPQVDGLPPAWW